MKTENKTLKDFLYRSENLGNTAYLVSREKLVLIFVIILIVTIRLAGIAYPNLNSTFWKEIDYIQISQNYIHNNFNFFKPTISWPAEPPNVTAMEFPLVPYLASWLYQIFGFNVYTVRILTLLSVVALMFYVERLSRLYFGAFVSMLAAFFTGLLFTYNTFGNLLYSEPLIVAFSIATLYYTKRCLDFDMKRFLPVTMIFFSISILLKPTTLYILIPMVFLFYEKYRYNRKIFFKSALWILLALVPAVAWYTYAYYLGRSSVDVFGIFGGHNKLQIFSELTDPEYYRIMAQRHLVLLGGYLGVLLFAIGLVYFAALKKGYVFIAYLISVIVFYLIVAEGNIDAPYRQLRFVPLAAVMMSLGITFIGALFARFIDLTIRHKRLILKANFLFLIAVSIGIAAYSFSNRGRFIKHNLIVAQADEWNLAKEIDKYVSPGDRIVTFGNYDIKKGGNDLSPVLYYYSKTVGWSMNIDELQVEKVQALKQKGAKLIVFLNMKKEPQLQGFAQTLAQYYPVVYKSGDSMILKY